ncbi:Oidioi.mRNA.OKI2018_I69.chr1.g1989.t1.cds [Oikopleura dioica]|uniref:Oidioi.mRNA.OKI2018_I69.chr1.g1989.t1.cds n=1 Tax=Oikopleura dioica TaxID=34765 RepID=A0ABN7SPP8_OIKDI|nr:Oidioi.mRNA.OKI2018_I69.chr1.g1989.t1.cds [Oikopleura dioica]
MSETPEKTRHTSVQREYLVNDDSRYPEKLCACRSEAWCKWFFFPSPLATYFIGKRLAFGAPIKYLIMGVILVVVFFIFKALSLFYTEDPDEAGKLASQSGWMDDPAIKAILTFGEEDVDWKKLPTMVYVLAIFGLTLIVLALIWTVALYTIRRKFDRLRGHDSADKACLSCLLTVFLPLCSQAQMGAILEGNQIEMWQAVKTSDEEAV